MNNRLKKILILIVSLTLGMLIYFECISVPCLFKSVTGIPCPGCGMTRAFNAILEFDIVTSFSYNILAIPLFIFFIFILVSLIFDIIKNEKTFENKLIKFLEKYYIIIIILLIISLIVNIFRNI